MGFIMSPLKLLQVISTSAEINRKLDGKGLKWYLSKEGGESHAKAKTLPQKVEYFYGLLRSFNSDVGIADAKFLQSMAYVIAATVDGTSKPYGVWPAIVDPEQNPLVGFAKEHRSADISTVMKMSKEHDIDYMELTYDVEQLTVARALAALRGSDDYEMFMYTTPGAYENLTSEEEDPELFLIERCIIFTLGDSGYYDSDNGVGPYNFGLSEDDENE